MKDLRITMVQADIIWEDIKGNLEHYENLYFSKIEKSATDLIILPELFATGFSMNTSSLAEGMDGDIVKWMQKWASLLDCQIGGSVIVFVDKSFFNRFLIVDKSGVISFYDKTHLFRMGDENKHFTPGSNRVIHEIKGWKILLQVCYDLRFPVFSRNRTMNGQKEYDAVVYVANWPEVRSNVWSTLLQARAMENQVYCIGVNRVGLDGNGINHSGDSAVIDPWGNVVVNTKKCVELVTNYSLSVDKKTSITSGFPAFLDADDFELTGK